MSSLNFEIFTSHPAFSLIKEVWFARVDASGTFLEWHGSECPVPETLQKKYDDVCSGARWTELQRHGAAENVRINDVDYHFHIHPFHDGSGALLSMRRSPPPAYFSSLGLLAGHLAHELRTPLQVLKERLHLLSDQIDTSKLSSLCDHMLNLVKGLHDLSKGDDEQVRVSLDLGHVVENALALAQSKLDRARIAVAFEQVCAAPVTGNLSQLTQVLLNLITNAIDAMETTPQKQLQIKLENQSEFFVLTVHDSGTGIASSMLKKLMKPYQTTKGKNGTGLGLHVSAQIIQKHHGTLRLRPTDQGACFEIVLPRLTEGNSFSSKN